MQATQTQEQKRLAMQRSIQEQKKRKAKENENPRQVFSELINLLFIICSSIVRLTCLRQSGMRDDCIASCQGEDGERIKSAAGAVHHPLPGTARLSSQSNEEFKS